MENITNLKNIKKIGWTFFVVAKGKDLSCVLVKKNLFKGYTVVKATGEKEKVDNLNFLNDLNIVSKSHQLFYQKGIFRSINDSFSLKNKDHQDDVNSLSTDIKILNEEVDGLKKDMERKVSEHGDFIKTSNYMQIEFLKDGFYHFGEFKVHKCGYECVEKSLTPWQREHGHTCNIVEEYFDYTDVFELNMDEYFKYLIDAMDDEDKDLGKYKDAAVSLQKYYKLFIDKIKKLEDTFDEKIYSEAFAMKMHFIFLFKEFIILWRTSKKNSDVSYSRSGTEYGTGDEKTEYTYSSYGLISQGQNACANLVGITLGEDEKKKFLEQIEILLKGDEMAIPDEKAKKKLSNC